MRTLIFVALSFGLATAALGRVETSLSADEELEIIEAANALDAAVDAKNWERARGLFAETIEIELPGAPRRSIPSQELVAMWAANLFPEKTSFHLRGGHIVEMDADGRVFLYSKAYAWNRLVGAEGGELWEVWGDYTYEMVRVDEQWLISSFTFSPTFDRGNSAVPTLQRTE